MRHQNKPSKEIKKTIRQPSSQYDVLDNAFREAGSKRGNAFCLSAFRSLFMFVPFVLSKCCPFLSSCLNRCCSCFLSSQRSFFLSGVPSLCAELLPFFLCIFLWLCLSLFRSFFIYLLFSLFLFVSSLLIVYFFRWSLFCYVVLSFFCSVVLCSSFFPSFHIYSCLSFCVSLSVLICCSLWLFLSFVRSVVRSFFLSLILSSSCFIAFFRSFCLSFFL